jgi:hypothetical protein
MKYSRGTAFLNLLSDSRLRWARHASAFTKAWHDPARAMGERISPSVNKGPASAIGLIDWRPYRQKL